MERISGYVEHITYTSLDTGFTVARLKYPKGKGHVCIVGTMPSLQPGETISCHGHWKNNAKYGLQFDVQEYTIEAPADLEGVKKYLESGLIKGIGPVYAGRIVKAFGLDTLDVIDLTPQRLLDVPGIGQKRVDQITSCWDEQKSIRNVMIFLRRYGVSPTYAQKIFKTYGDSSIEKVTQDPYILARDIFGIGFKIADSIAQKLGMPHDSEARIEAGIEYVLSQLSSEGHTCYPVDDFIPIAQEILEVDADVIKTRISVLEMQRRVAQDSLFVDGENRLFLWLKALQVAEQGIASEVGRLKYMSCALRSVDTTKAIAWAQEQLNFVLASNQKLAVVRSLEDKIAIITGGPGTGKSTITNVTLTILSKLTNKILLAAPTGRAAKRLSEITKCDAKTIHSLLEFDFRIMGFKRNRKNPLECDLLIVDEASMIDTSLMYSLLKAVPDHARVIFVGDVDQLPSVGPGNVLRDMIESQQISATKLTDIFRQAAGSNIVVNAHRINKGEFPYIRNNQDSDFFFKAIDDPEDILSNIVDMVSYRIPQRYGFDPINDIQVLAPMKRGVIGIENLNSVLQRKLNPKTGTIMRNGRYFLLDDKVMQIRNDYKKDVYNGDVGRIADINDIEREVLVRFDDREVLYDFSDLDELVLAYAVSTHKFQGCECPCVVMPVHTTHYKMLHRNLLYTAVTRGKKLVVLVGTTKALAIAVNNNEVGKRYAGLRQWMMGTKL